MSRCRPLAFIPSSSFATSLDLVASKIELGKVLQGSSEATGHSHLDGLHSFHITQEIGELYERRVLQRQLVHHTCLKRNCPLYCSGHRATRLHHPSSLPPLETHAAEPPERCAASDA